MPDTHCRSSRDAAGRLVVRSHAAVVAVAADPQVFSNAVSRHLQIPNGLDGVEHAAARRLLDPFFSPQALAPLLPLLDGIARALVADFGVAGFDAVAALGARYAVRGQSAWLGWGTEMEDDLLDWRAANLDPDAFADPHRFDPEAHAARNLVYGSGPHACPGRPLATAELRVLVHALLEAGGIEFDPACPPVREQPPVAGYRSVHVRIVAGA